MAAEPIVVYILKISTVILNKEALLSKLSQQDLSRFNRYLCEEDKLRFLGGRALIYRHVGTPIEFEEKGKPFVRGAQNFSISHSGDYIAIALDKVSPVGVDIEGRREVSDLLIERVCSKQEINLIHAGNPDLFFEIWTKKEALTKCTGTGITVPLNEINVAKNSEIEYTGRLFYISHTLFDGHHLSVCATRNFGEMLIQQETQIV